MNYTLHQLEVFLKITQTKNITKASEELNLTQPAVSIQLKNFQNQFEIPLTEVVGRKLFVTDFGKEIAAAAENILNEVKAINHKSVIYKGHLAGRLKLSVVSTAQYVIPYFLSGFLKQHQEVELVMDVTNKSKVIESLEKNQVDFSLVSVLPDQMAIDKVELMTNKLYLVGNAEQKFHQKPYEKSILNELPFIYREQGSGTRHVIERFIERHRLKVKKKMELTSNEAVKQAVLAGLGYSIMPLIGIGSELVSGHLQIIPVKDFPIKSTWHLIWLKNKRFSPVAEQFLHYLKNEKSKIIKEQFEWFESYK